MILAAGVFPAMLSGCGTELPALSASYHAEAVSDRFKGSFVSESVTTVACEGLRLLKENGDRVKKGNIIAELSDEDIQAVELLKQKRDSCQQKLDKLSRQLEQLASGDGAGCTELRQQLNAAADSVQAMQTQLQESSLARSEAELSYQQDMEEISLGIAKNETRIAELDALLETAYTLPDETREKQVTLWENERAGCAAELESLDFRRSYRSSNYEQTLARIALTDSSTNAALEKNEQLYRQLAGADPANPTVAALVASADEAKESCQSMLCDLDRQIAQYGEQRIVAEYDGQLAVNGSTVTLYSDALQFVFRATEKQMETLSAQPDLRVETGTGSGTLQNSTVLCENAGADPGGTVYFRMVFDVTWEQQPEQIMNGSTGVLVTPPVILVPEKYLSFTDGVSYATVNGTKTPVDAEKTAEGWLIRSGIRAGDTLQPADGEAYD